jgi:hypothetical protein
LSLQLVAPLLLLFATFGASLSVGDRFPITLNKDGLDRFFIRSMVGDNVKQLIRGLWLIATELMH